MRQVVPRGPGQAWGWDWVGVSLGGNGEPLRAAKPRTESVTPAIEKDLSPGRPGLWRTEFILTALMI